MTAQPKQQLTFAEWLEGERNALDEWHEYVGGEVFAMSGGTAEHYTLITNTSGALWSQTRGKPCQVFTQGMRLKVRAGDAGKYPDLMALCGEPEFHDGRRDMLINPSLIVEVLSTTTEGYDRGEKFALYRELTSLQEYLLIAQHRVSAELYTRADGGSWLLTAFDDLNATVVLPSIGCELRLREVYDKVRFPADFEAAD